ncbi:MAG: hypothetical protein V8R75_04775 [Oscillospiraceae bacterium]
MLCGSAINCLGSLMLMDDIVELLPNPAEGNYHKATKADGETEEFVAPPAACPRPMYSRPSRTSTASTPL